MTTKACEVRIAGPLAPHSLGFHEELTALHYTPLSAANQLRVMAHLSRWLDRKRWEPRDLTADRVEAFLRARRRAGYTCWRSLRGVGPLLGYLRRSGIVPDVPPPTATTAVDRLVNEYADYLRHECGLTQNSVRFREGVARELVASLGSDDVVGLGALTAAHVTGFILERTRRYCVGTAGGIATALRSLLRFLHVRGHIPAPLVGAVPKIAGWRLTSLPRAIESERVGLLLRACDRRTAMGRGDYAILVVLVRLGLRAGEVAGLLLDDIDWRRGELIIRGKGRRHDRMPLAADVGDAIAAYLRRGRPASDSRAVFVSSRAPHRSLSSRSVSARVVSASARAGIGRVSAHRLRHTAATQILRCGGSLADIAEVLRHRSIETTAIYAKVDRDALRLLAQPWPGAA